MLKFGIVGAENSHCAAIAKICNIDKAVAARVAAVWGEAPRFAKAAAEQGDIAITVRDWREMAGLVDGVMIDHRHPDPHYEVARYFINHGLPVFVDKPMTYRLSQAKRLCSLAERKKVSITSFSVIPLQASFAAFRKAAGKLGRLAAVTSTGPADLKSKNGGVFFYGIHQVDTVIELLGLDVDTVELKQHGRGGVAILTYRDGPVVTINCINNGNHTFHLSAVGEKTVLSAALTYDDNPYLRGAKLFTQMFRTGLEPFAYRRLLAPVAVLEAMEKSLTAKGARIKVARF